MDEDVVHVGRWELYPKKTTVKDDGCPNFEFTELPGECIEFAGRSLTDDVIAISNYRLLLFRKSRILVNIPVRLIQSVTHCQNHQVLFSCKHSAPFRIIFLNTEQAQKWMVRLNGKIATPKSHKEFFAYSYWAWSQDQTSLTQSKRNNDQRVNKQVPVGKSRESGNQYYSIFSEFNRLGFQISEAWQISDLNSQDYKLCKSYPRLHIIPRVVKDSVLEGSAKFRSSGRFPSVVWRHKDNRVVLARCSQPLLGWFSWRSQEDEEMLRALSDACLNDRKHILLRRLGTDRDTTDYETFDAPRLLIVDARSYSAAVANRTKGGGCECKEYYPNSDIVFMNLPNIHAVRKSFQAICNLCTSSADASSWLSSIESSQWLYYLSQLMQSACQVVKTLDIDCRPVLVHCSDGWDRTPQLTSLAEIMLDPFYRTVPGFTVLVEREWLSFGHKFSTRCGHRIGDSDSTQQSPVFLQWLDCIHQLLLQFPTAFEFNEAYLVKLALHTYSCLYGTFLYNCAQEREQQKEMTVSLWSFLSNDDKSLPFRNLLYVDFDQVLIPDCHIQHLQIWTTLYCTSHPVSLETLKSNPLTVNPCSSLPTSPVTALPAKLTPRLTRSKSETSLSGEAIEHQGPSAPMWDEQLSHESLTIPSSYFKGLPREQYNLHSGLDKRNQHSRTELPPSYNTVIAEGDNTSTHHRTNAGSSQQCDSRPATEQNCYDFDGLNPLVDPLQKQLCEMSLEHERQLNSYVKENESLKRQVKELKERIVSPDRQGNNQCNLLEDAQQDEPPVGNVAESPSSFDDSHWEKVHKEDAETVLWVPDHAATRCFHCNSKFWLAKRRHHCRNCGKLFCYYCSNYFVPVPEEQLYEPVRVCLRCYHKLDGNQYDQRQQQTFKVAA